MNAELTVGLIRQDREFSHCMTALGEQLTATRPLPLVINGLSAGALDAFLCETVRTVTQESKICSLLLVASDHEASRLTALLQKAGLRALHYPGRHLVFYPMTASHDLSRERLSVLYRITCGEADCIVSTPGAAMQFTVPPDRLAASALRIRPGDRLDPDTLCRHLTETGYAQVDTVESAGQYARRGGILDVYPNAATPPVRMEFFGDEIDRLCHFDPLTQRVSEECGELCLLPAREIALSDEGRKTVAAEIERRLKACRDENGAAALRRESAALLGGEDAAFSDKYMALIYPPASLFDYMSLHTPRYPILIPDTNATRESMRATLSLLHESISAMLENHSLSGKIAHYMLEEGELDAQLDRQVPLYINTFSSGLGGIRTAGLFGFRCRRMPSYGANTNLLLEDLAPLLKGGYRVVLACDNTAARAGLAQLLTDAHLSFFTAEESGTLPEQGGQIALIVSDVESGFDLMTPRVALLTTASGEGGRAAARPLRQSRRIPAGKKILSYADLSEGDLVVHPAHGIGRFEGMQTLKIAGVTRDYITIAYAGADKLFLPADRIEQIAKYIGAGAEDGSVKLSRMGGADWQKKKARAKSAARDMAQELLSLYAARQKRPGFAFPPDSELEAEFDEAFTYEETPPQLEAIEEIKRDMEKPVPMDRLLCGDVGYGKTEVAFRAAFKAIAAGKQVAILVPTTLLALQHYQTALSRMHGFAVTVDMLSRFRTPGERKTVLGRLRRGEIDLVVGTHALLGKQVVFKDLGLLIVDEEQRFGVAQKERLKQMAQNVDVLTLTATPIPRTLNMAMSGIRDMSILDEAPGDRRPVQTYVLEHDDGILAEAMRRELARGGQVLYLYNRVEDIDLVAGRVMKLLPEARVVYAHGQMERDTLEDIWQALVRGEIDILVCTTIIETGVDLPNANTLIIERADRMGLAQLHQIRGRVGRSGRQAYAYFTYRRGQALSDVAAKRLSAIREFAEFGAGFKIALRDLEIRGAGNLLGPEQHGHIDAVGYDLYIRLLNEAILDAEGKKPPDPFEAKVEIQRDANIPVSYISRASHRMEMYKKITLIQNHDDLTDVLDQFCDRFGEPPAPTVTLLWIALTRAIASRLHIARVAEQGAEIRFFPERMEAIVWADVFTRRPGMRFLNLGGAAVAAKLEKGEDPARTAAGVLMLYEQLRQELIPKEDAEHAP